MISLRKYGWTVALALVVFLGLLFAFWPRAVTVETGAVSIGPMTQTVADDGVTRIREVYTVTTPVAGRILRIEKRSGDAVVAGKTVVATLLPATSEFLNTRSRLEREASIQVARDAHTAAAAQAKSAAATLDYTQAELKRTQKLFKDGIDSAAKLDQVRHEMQRAAAGLTAAQAVLRQREAELKRAEAGLVSAADKDEQGIAQKSLKILAPESGKILNVFHKSEAVLTAGAPVMDIGDPRNIEIVADLLSRDAVKVSAGDPVLITNWGGAGALNGKVRRVEPVGTTKVSSLGVEEQRVNVIIDLTDPPVRWQALGHGYQVDVQVVIWQDARALRVPVGALFRHGNAWAVFRDENGHARLRAVDVAHLTAQYAEVRSGLKAGDRVVVYPGDQVSDGQLIRPAVK